MTRRASVPPPSGPSLRELHELETARVLDVAAKRAAVVAARLQHQLATRELAAEQTRAQPQPQRLEALRLELERRRLELRKATRALIGSM